MDGIVETVRSYKNESRHNIRERIVDGQVVEKEINRTDDLHCKIREHIVDGRVE